MSALILISVLGVLVLYMGLFGNKRALAPVAILGLLATLGLFITGWNIELPMFSTMVRFDEFSTWFNGGMIVITILIFLFGIDYYDRMKEHVAEHYTLMLFSLVGAFLLTSFNNLLVLFLGIEILSIPLYVLAGGKRKSRRSGEAAFKYFLLGSFASGFFLMGIALLYGSAASFDLATVRAYAAGLDTAPDMLFILGLFFTAIGLSFKIAAAPFHFWSPDVYEGAPTLVTSFMATVVKMAAFAAFFRFLQMTAMPTSLGRALLVMTIATLLIGNIVALRQSQFKRLMAYSSIAHSGFLLLALLSESPLTGRVLFYYTFTYALATVGLFIVLTLAKRSANGDENIRIFRGLFRARPWLAIVTMVLLLSLAGIPLTAGFIAKYQVFLLAIGGGFIKTTLFAVVMALVGIYYYVLVIREAFTPAEESAPMALVVNPLNWLVLSLCGIAVVVFGVLPGLLG
ncbi:MAG: NADH-quinone oxidoreductase subunit N [Flavobacteriales bacterium]|nr:NADH-quinone oxidoreductase subunit N [Flavobacteriales bacterium]